jgi:hypothetical protein
VGESHGGVGKGDERGGWGTVWGSGMVRKRGKNLKTRFTEMRRSIHLVVRPDVDEEYGVFCVPSFLDEIEDDPQVVARTASP